MVKIKIGNVEWEGTEQEANYIKSEFERNRKILKEFGIGQIAVFIGGLYLGKLATDLAQQIIEDLHK